MLLPMLLWLLFLFWQMLLPTFLVVLGLADVIAKDYVLILCFQLADVKPHMAGVVCQVADGIATYCNRWQMLLPGGRCCATPNCCVSIQADVIA